MNIINNGIIDLRSLTTLETVDINSYPDVTDVILSGLSSLTTISINALPELLRLYVDNCTALADITNSLIPDNVVELHAANTGAASVIIESKDYLISIDVSDSAELTSISLDTLSALETLNFDNCLNLSTFSFTSSSGITSLVFPNGSQITQLILTELNNLIYLNMAALSQLDSLFLTNLESLTSTNLNGLISLTHLSLVDWLSLASIDLTPLSALTSLTVQNTPNVVSTNLNSLNHLPSPNLLTSLTLNQMETLVTANVTRFTNINTLSLTNCSALESIVASGCSQLREVIVLVEGNQSLKNADLNGTALSSYAMTTILQTINANEFSDGIIDLRVINGAVLEAEALDIVSQLELRGYTVYSNVNHWLELLTPGTNGGRWNSDGKLSLFDLSSGGFNITTGLPVGKMTDQFSLGNDITQVSATSRPTLSVRENRAIVEMDLVDDAFEWPFDGVTGTFWFVSLHGAQCFTLDAQSTMPVIQFMEAGFIDRIVTGGERALILDLLNGKTVEYHDIEAMSSLAMDAYLFNEITGHDFDDTGSPVHLAFQSSGNSPDLPPWTSYGTYSYISFSGYREYADIVVTQDANLLNLGLQSTYGKVQDLTRWPNLESYSDYGGSGGKEGAFSVDILPANLQAISIGGSNSAQIEGRVPDFSSAACSATLKYFSIDANWSGTLDLSGFTALEHLSGKITRVTSVNCSGATALNVCYFNGADSLEDDGLDLTGCTSLTTFGIDGENSALTTLSIPDSPNLSDVSISSFQNLTTISLHPSAVIANINANATALYSSVIDSSAFGISSALVNFTLYQIPATEIDFSGFTNLLGLTAQGCTSLETVSATGCTSLVSVGITGGNTALKNVNFNGSNLREYELDYILDRIDVNGFSGGSVDIRVLNGVVPTGAGMGSIAHLLSRGYTVLHN